MSNSFLFRVCLECGWGNLDFCTLIVTFQDENELQLDTKEKPLPEGKRRESIFIPEVENSIGSPSSEIASAALPDDCLIKLNEFLVHRDVSPVRNKLSVSWDDAHERTKRRYTRKAKQSVHEVLEVIAPGQSDKLLTELGDKVATEQRGITKNTAERSQAQVELLEALAESYFNATHWSTKRQILSIMADKLPLKEIKNYIPGLTRYRFDIARHHRPLHGRGAVVPVNSARRMKVDYAQLDHFLHFITSPHIVQDLPFGEKMLKLSTGEVLKTPNVIRMLIPERITQQYFQFCAETKFTPMSKSTLLRVLDACSASVRKSLQGLDNFSAQGSSAFEDLCETVDRITDQAKSQALAKETKQILQSSKQYLKADYKVSLHRYVYNSKRFLYRNQKTSLNINTALYLMILYVKS